jgi:hypothetical protein
MRAGGLVLVAAVADPARLGRAARSVLPVREADVSDSLLVDPQLDLSFLGSGTVLADPYSEFSTNQVRVRVETEARFHGRNVLRGAYQIA